MAAASHVLCHAFTTSMPTLEITTRFVWGSVSNLANSAFPRRRVQSRGDRDILLRVVDEAGLRLLLGLCVGPRFRSVLHRIAGRARARPSTQGTDPDSHSASRESRWRHTPRRTTSPTCFRFRGAPRSRYTIAPTARFPACCCNCRSCLACADTPAGSRIRSGLLLSPASRCGCSRSTEPALLRIIAATHSHTSPGARQALQAGVCPIGQQGRRESCRPGNAAASKRHARRSRRVISTRSTSRFAARAPRCRQRLSMSS